MRGRIACGGCGRGKVASRLMHQKVARWRGRGTANTPPVGRTAVTPGEAIVDSARGEDTELCAADPMRHPMAFADAIDIGAIVAQQRMRPIPHASQPRRIVAFLAAKRMAVSRIPLAA